MNIRTKVLLLFFTSLLTLVIVLAFFRQTQQRQNEIVLKSAAEQQITLLNTAINVQSDQIDQIVLDYTNWDELIVNMRKPNQSWAEDNIASIIKSFKLSTVSVYGTDQQLIYGFGKKEKNLLTCTSNTAEILQLIRKKGAIHFFWSNHGEILEIAGSTIHATLDSVRVKPSSGYFMISRSWNKSYLTDLADDTQGAVYLTNANPDKNLVIANDSITVSKPLLGYNQEVVENVVIKKPNSILVNYKNLSDLIFYIVSTLIFFLLLVFFLTLYRWIRRPLKIISDSLKNNDSSRLIHLEKNKDEFSQIARLISIFHLQKMQLEQENREVNLMQHELIKQSNVLRGMALASNHLLTNDDFDTAIHDALEAISLASGIDRIFIYKNKTEDSDHLGRLELLDEYVDPSFLYAIDSVDYKNIQLVRSKNNWYEPLKLGQTVKGPTAEFSTEFLLILEKQLIKSLMIFPILDQHSKELWGIVGFAECKGKHDWTPSEETVLGMLAYNIGGAIRRRQSQIDLLKALELAKTADRAKSEFLASMSHEIRTPMNGVIGMTSLLLMTDLTEAQREYVNIIENSGESLMNIINEILDFSKIETGRMELEESTFNLRLCIEDVLDLMAPRAQEKHLDIMYYIDPQVNQHIFGDGFRLRQIIVNLVSNAIRFTEKGEIFILVTLQVSQKNEVILEFSVKDTGIGIPADKIETLFSPFTQVDASTTRKYGGTGLGLAITYSLVKLMKGKVWVNSELGVGSDFRFTIKTNFSIQGEETNRVRQSLKNLSRKSVLIVDDNATNRKILTLQCESWGLQPIAFESGKAALLYLQNNHFDIGILDMQMPEMDGIMLALEIKKIPDFAELPLIMLTSIGYNSNVKETQKLFAAYVNKPIKHTQLSEIILKILSPLTRESVEKKKSEEELSEISKKFPFQILVAEDNMINQKLVKNVFELLGYKMDIAANGLEVLDSLKRKYYDLIFMDIQMPEMNGYEATGIILNSKTEERPIIIAMTANAMRGDREKCLEAGMDDYITKPIRVDDLIKVLEFWGNKKFE